MGETPKGPLVDDKKESPIPRRQPEDGLRGHLDARADANLPQIAANRFRKVFLARVSINYQVKSVGVPRFRKKGASSCRIIRRRCSFGGASKLPLEAHSLKRPGGGGRERHPHPLPPP